MSKPPKPRRRPAERPLPVTPPPVAAELLSEERPDCCGRCDFGQPIEGQPQLMCRRFPPTARPLNNADVANAGPDMTLARLRQLATVWPIVGKLDYCGEFKRRPAAPAQIA